MPTVARLVQEQPISTVYEYESGVGFEIEAKERTTIGLMLVIVWNILSHCREFVGSE